MKRDIIRDNGKPGNYTKETSEHFGEFGKL
jgi:hypothetical protein